MRRTRFTAIMVDGSKRVIRAYSSGSARQYYEERGFSVQRVEKGDYRKNERVAKAKASGGFRINRAELANAIKILGLELPVNVRFHARVGNTNGNYRLTNNKHNIMLKSYLTPEQATKTLWHELTHARQAEEAFSIGVPWSQVRNDQKAYSYKIRPIEIEARRISAEMTAKHSPLCY